ncbi:MAG: dTDP-4-dehydrorhamnose 3,5-epimerase [Bdellovibrionales bacterium]
MKAVATKIPDVFIFEPTVFGDARGFFFESFNQRVFEEATGASIAFVQDNHSKSAKGVLRGLHYQADHAQGKLVRVTHGAVWDVVVDIRPNSPTLGQWVGEFLTAENKKQLWVPGGFAHAFVALEDDTEFLYKVTDFRYAEFERTLVWNDPTVGIQWPINFEPQLSAKDTPGTAWTFEQTMTEMREIAKKKAAA